MHQNDNTNNNTGHTTMNIGVLKLCRIYYSDLTITNYTSNERTTICSTSIRLRAHVWFLRLPLEALVAKMAGREQKAFCVLQFAKTESAIRMQLAFHIKFHFNPPSDNNIRRRYHQFKDTACLCKGKSSGRPSVIEERVERVCDAFARSPKKSVRRASRELAIPVMSVWRILRRCLQLRPYRLQLLQALKSTDYGARSFDV